MRKNLICLSFILLTSTAFAQPSTDSMTSDQPSSPSPSVITTPVPGDQTAAPTSPVPEDQTAAQPGPMPGMMMPAASDVATKECDSIANSCLSAGYNNNNTQDKRFWQDCMRALLLNQTVSGVNVSADEISACRDAKITKLQQDLQDLQSAKDQKM